MLVCQVNREELSTTTWLQARKKMKSRLRHTDSDMDISHANRGSHETEQAPETGRPLAQGRKRAPTTQDTEQHQPDPTTRTRKRNMDVGQGAERLASALKEPERSSTKKHPLLRQDAQSICSSQDNGYRESGDFRIGHRRRRRRSQLPHQSHTTSTTRGEKLTPASVKRSKTFSSKGWCW